MTETAEKWTEIESNFLNRWMNRKLWKRWEEHLSKVLNIDKKETSETEQKQLALLERFTIASDNDGHEYVIPLYLKKDFDEWLNDKERSTYEECDRFNQYRRDGGILTFTDPKVN